jgi:hypothetical protein
MLSMTTGEEEWMRELTWTDASGLRIGGLGWRGEERLRPFDRLPAALREAIPGPTWWLSQQSAGVFVDFRSAARTLAVRWEMAPADDLPRDPYMPRSGRAGVDLYGRDGHGKWQWVGAQEPFGDPQANGNLSKGPLDGVERDYRLYLPLLRQTLRVEIGADAPVQTAEADPRPPIIYYGTSIVHGAGVSRPGCGHAQRLEMALDAEILNLGFCGRAHCETSLAECIARQPARMVIVDPLPNNSPENLEERLLPFLEIVGKGHPDIPILLVEERLFGDAAFVPERGTYCNAKNRALHETIRQRRAAGQDNLHLVTMPDYYGPDGSTDANHPNDLGADRLFRRLLPEIRARL